MPLVNALWITLIGMGLVFLAILMLWGLMALLVRLTAEKEEVEAPAEEPPARTASEPVPAQAQDRKRRAAAVAVAFALAQQNRRGGGLAAPAATTTREPQAAGELSPWLAVNRAGRLSQKSMTSRKKVVR